MVFHIRSTAVIHSCAVMPRPVSSFLPQLVTVSLFNQQAPGALASKQNDSSKKLHANHHNPICSLTLAITPTKSGLSGLVVIFKDRSDRRVAKSRLEQVVCSSSGHVTQQ